MAQVIREKAVFDERGGMPTMRFANQGMGLHSLESFEASGQSEAQRRLCGLAVVKVEQAAQAFRLHYIVTARQVSFDDSSCFRSGSGVRERNYVTQSLMISFVVIVGDVFAECMEQRAFAKEDELVEAFFFDGAHPAFGKCVEVGGTWRQLQRLSADTPKQLVKGVGELAVAVVQKIAGAWKCVFFSGHVAGDLFHPSLVGGAGRAAKNNLAGAHLDEEQDVVGGQSRLRPDLGGEKVGCPEDIFVAADELSPRQAPSAGEGRSQSVLAENVAYGLSGNGVTEVGERARDAVVTPQGILPRKLDDELFYFDGYCRPARPCFMPAGEIPLFGNELAMPFEERFGLHDCHHLAQQFAKRFALLGQSDAFLVIQSPVRGVALEDGAIDAVFFQNVFEFAEQSGFDLAGGASENSFPRHGRRMIEFAWQIEAFGVSFGVLVAGVPLSGIYVHAYGPAYLSQITDRNANRIELVTSGTGVSPVHRVDYYSPSNVLTKSLLFHRDGQGRIDAIYDPQSLADAGWDPNSSAGVPPVPCVVYSYDAAGNLAVVSNLLSRTGVPPVSSPVYSATQYIYTNPNFPHFITEIRDPRGISPLRNLYDDSGKLVGVVDAFGKTNSFTHDVANHTETVTDRMGNQTMHAYDDRGNIISTTDALGHTTTRTYDDNNNETSVTDPLGHVTYFGYDDKGNRTSVTDPNTNTTYFVYDSFGNILSTSNAVGVVIQNQYDAAGNLTVMANALGLAMTNLYDDAGHNIGTVDNTGSASFGYDGSGNITGSTGSDGVTHTLQYDANGNMTNTFYQWTNPNNPSDVRTLTSRTDYDASGRITKTVDADGNQMQTIYDELGKPAQTINALGGTNTFVYDAKDNVIEMDYPDGTITRTVYDANGRSVVTTDRYVPGNQANGMRTTYDTIGRVVETERLSNVVVSVTSPGGLTQSAFISASSVVATNL